MDTMFSQSTPADPDISGYKCLKLSNWLARIFQPVNKHWANLELSYTSSISQEL